jgi:hypothetical protein
MKSAPSAQLNTHFPFIPVRALTCFRLSDLGSRDHQCAKAHDVKALGGQLILFQAVRTITYSEASGAVRHTYNTLEIMKRYVFCYLELQQARSPPYP